MELLNLLLLLLSLISLGSSEGRNMPPSIRAESESSREIFYQNGENVDLPCQLTGGYPQPTVQWIKDGLPINQRSGRASVTEDGTLHITEASMFDTGTYHCRASNDYGVAIGGMAFVLLSTLSRFPDQPREAHVVSPRESLKMRCEQPDSFPPPRVFWKTGQQAENSFPVVLDERKSMDDFGNLYFTSVLPEDETDPYRCALLNSVLDVEVIDHPQYISINQRKTPAYIAPHALWNSFPQPVGFTDEALTLKCIVGGFPTPVIQWTGPNGAVPHRHTQDHGRELVIAEVDTADGGLYSCSAGDGAVRTEFNVTVHVKPHWTSRPETMISVAEGDNMRVECPASAEPPVEIEWFFNGVSISALSSDPRLSVSRDRRLLTLKRLTDVDMRVVQCYASNHDGYVFANFAISVNPLPPYFMEHFPVRTSAATGETVLLTCSARGAPKPDLTWFKDGTLIESNDRVQVLNSGTLRINNAVPDDQGRYTCKIENKYGEVTTSGNLVVEGRETSRRPSPTPTAHVTTTSHITLYFRLTRYTNHDGTGANGHCCDGKYGVCQGGDGCDHRFVLCLDYLRGDPEDAQECSYWRRRSSKISNNNDIQFGSSVGGLDNEFSEDFVVTFDDHMKTVARLKIAVWDDDRFTGDDFVDFLSRELIVTEGDVVTKDHWTVTIEARTTLQVDLWVACAQDYYGTRCDRHCVHPSGSDEGSYICDVTTGDKVCLPGYTGVGCSRRKG